MSTQKTLFESLRRAFDQNGSLKRVAPLYEVLESVFVTRPRFTATAPVVRDSLDVKRYMMLVIVALLPHYGFGVYNVGCQALLASGHSPNFLRAVFIGFQAVVPIVAVVFAVGFTWEVVFAVIRRHPISEGVLVTCTLLPLTLPPTIPLWQAALGISFGIVIGKEIFGGTGRNFLNPALTGRAFLYFAYPAQISGDAVWTLLIDGKTAAVDAFSGATPLSIAGNIEKMQDVHVVLSDTGYTFTKLFFGLYPGSIGGTATFLCVIGAGFLILLGIANYRIIIGCILGLLTTAGILNMIAGPNSMPYLSLNPFYHLVMGGSMFAFAYMATDPVSSCHMQGARWVFGFCIGVLTVLIRVFNPAFPEGVGLAVLFMNIFAPLFDEIEIKIRLKRRVPNV